MTYKVPETPAGYYECDTCHKPINVGRTLIVGYEATMLESAAMGLYPAPNEATKKYHFHLLCAPTKPFDPPTVCPCGQPDGGHWHRATRCSGPSPCYHHPFGQPDEQTIRVLRPW